MSFTPVIPVGGYAGWIYLQRTLDVQKKTFDSQPANQREEDYFRQNIHSISSAEQLVNDPRLLRVALTAFGLEADFQNKFFIKKVLEDGVTNTGALANKLANKQYQKLSAAFGFGEAVAPKSKLPGFADKVLPLFRMQKFSAAVGLQDGDMRLAMNAQTELPSIAKLSNSDAAGWFTILGNPPLRSVFEKAFGLPTSFGAIDIDKQLETFKRRSLSLFGSDNIEQFSDADKVEGLVKRFLINSELSSLSSVQNSGSIALTLLQSVGRYRSY